MDLAVIASLTTRCCHKAVLSCCDSHMCVHVDRERERVGEREGVCGREQLVKFCQTLREVAGQLGESEQPEKSER